MSVDLRCGNVLDVLRMMPDESVHCVVTSPPYWGLRAYGTDPQVWLNGHEPCQEHQWADAQQITVGRRDADMSRYGEPRGTYEYTHLGGPRVASNGNTCLACGAWRGELGLEPTPELYVEHLVAIFREVRRVLRDDGVMFLNLGDSYMGSGGAGGWNINRNGAKDNPNRRALSSTQRVPSCDTSGTVPQGCPLRGSIWNRPCDGCQAASVLRTFGNDHPALSKLDDDSRDPNREHTESGRDHLPTSHYAHQIQTRQSSDAIQGQPQKQDHGGEPLPVSQASTLDASSCGSCRCDSNQSRVVECQDEFHSVAGDAQGCARKVVSPHETWIGGRESVGQPSRNHGNGETDDSSACHTEGTVYDSCPYLHYSTTSHRTQVLKPKDLVGIPWMVAFALRADGWYLRSDIIWAKPNPMPESVRDRPTKAHEYIFLMSKSPRYYYDADAIREEAILGYRISKGGFRGGGAYTGGRSFNNDTKVEPAAPPLGYDKGAGRNKRSVWTVTTKPLKLAHFATFPPDLIEPMILAGTSERGVCPECGAPWERVTDTERIKMHGGERRIADVNGVSPTSVFRTGLQPITKTLGWRPTCACDAGAPVPATVMDIFSGAGTTGVVAVKHGRNYVGIDLKAEYNEMARERIGKVQIELQGAH